MRMTVLAAGAIMLASCTTAEMPAMNAGAGQQQTSTTYPREAPVPPALRTPRQKSGVGWPNLGYRPSGY
jgi:hypothetical protein